MQGIKCNALRHWKVQIILNKTYHPFRGRNIFKKQTRNCLFEIKCIFLGRKENAINHTVFAKNLLRGSHQTNISFHIFVLMSDLESYGHPTYQTTAISRTMLYFIKSRRYFEILVIVLILFGIP